MFKTIIYIAFSITFIYCLLWEEKDEEYEPPKKTNKKLIKVKRNGQWVDEEDKR